MSDKHDLQIQTLRRWLVGVYVYALVITLLLVFTFMRCAELSGKVWRDSAEVELRLSNLEHRAKFQDAIEEVEKR